MSDQAESIERDELRAWHDAATPELRRSLALQLNECGSALVSIAGALPASAVVINRAIGLGVDAPATREDVHAIVQMYRDAGVQRYFIQRHPESRPPELVDWLLEAGLEKARGWQKFERGMEPAPIVETDLSIRRLNTDQGDTFARVACDAFDLGNAAIPWVASLAGRDNWHFFMSYYGAEPAGTGALFVSGGYGWTDFGATASKFRRRGGQAALLAVRINHAIALGCRRLYTCTGEEVVGDPQHSYRNIVKAGFHETLLKENYAPPR